MIDKAEMDAKAREFEIHTSSVQKDYVFGWLLFGIFTVSGLKDSIFLKGGNALRKGYFENTRFSRDLDFGIPNNIEQAVLLAEINSVCDAIQEKAGVTFVKNEVEEKFNPGEEPLTELKVYEARVYFKDFYSKADHIKLRISMDITRFDKVLLPLQTKRLIHPYSDAHEVACDIRCMKLEEIIATKMKCLMQRQHAPDLFDYAYSIQLLGGELNKQEVVQTVIQKTIFSRNPVVLKNILLKTAFDYFKQEWANSIVCAKQVVMSAEDAIATFVNDLEILFAGYSDNGFAQFAYFGAEFRAPIMQAARSQTLLKIRYKGEERMVEPYSLKYQQRRDGEAREYFWTHKLSGGVSAEGTRCFVADGMESIENTNIKFAPRFQIELSKAGEMPENRYLFDPNKPDRAPRSRVFNSFGRQVIKYRYQCRRCGKKIIKSTRDSTIGSHKSKIGYPCQNTYGIYLGTM